MTRLLFSYLLTVAAYTDTPVGMDLRAIMTKYLAMIDRDLAIDIIVNWHI